MANLILSVDDSATMRRMVGRVVATLGFELLEASDGLEALELLARHGPDVAVVVMDVNMPRMDGEEALQAIKADPRLAGIPVMMLTTESERSRVLGFIQKIAANYLMKPFTPEDLSTKIAGCLGDLF